SPQFQRNVLLVISDCVFSCLGLKPSTQDHRHLVEVVEKNLNIP
ncbi:hypothetical protein Tco_1061633, partial [Tanacetum coccineum]